MLIWYGAGAVVAIVIAWLAALAHASGHAPLGLVSLAVGIALGVVLKKIADTQRITCRRRLLIGTLLLAIVAVLAEHTWLYLDFRRQWQETRQRTPQVAIFRQESPWSLQEFFANEATPQRITVWCIDALIIVAGAVGIVAAHSRTPGPQSPAPSP